MAPVLNSVQDGSMVMFWCPGCQMNHGVWVRGKAKNPVTGGEWDWNGDMVKPTFSPSILVRTTVPITDAEADRIMNGEKIEPILLVCHSFVRDGQIQFLGDCTHSLSGQTVSLPAWEA